MIHEIQVKILVEAETREKACRLLAPFIENPRNPNLLPRSATRLSFYFSYDGWRAKEEITPKTKGAYGFETSRTWDTTSIYY